MAGPSGLFPNTLQIGDLTQAAMNLIPRPGAITQVGTGTIIPAATNFSALDGVNWRGVQQAFTIGANTFTLWILEKYNTNASYASGGAFTNAWIPVRGYDIEETNAATSYNSGYEYSFIPTNAAADVVVEGNNYYLARQRFENTAGGGPGGITTYFAIETIQGGVWGAHLQLGDAQMSSAPKNAFAFFDINRNAWYHSFAPRIIAARSSGAPIANTVAETDLCTATIPANTLADGDQLRGEMRMEMQASDLVNAATFALRGKYDGNNILSYTYTPTAGVPYLTAINLQWQIYRRGTNIKFYFSLSRADLPAGLSNTITQGSQAMTFNANKVFKFTIQFANLSPLNIATFDQSEYLYLPTV